MRKKIFVTGATGFIGANLVRRLMEEKYELHILKRKDSNIWRIKDIISNLYSHEVDLLEKKSLSRLLRKLKPKIIFHLANLGLYGGNDFPLEESVKINLLGTANLIESANQIDYECFVNTGSSSEYGDKTDPMHELSICEPNNNYALAKLASTLYAQIYAKKTRKPLTTLRLFSPFGPFDHPSRFITQTIFKLLKDKKISVNNSNAVRDYIFVDDITEAFIKCLENPDKISGEIFNIGSGKQTRIKDVLELLTKKLASKSQIVYDNSAKNKKIMWQANIQKAKQKLGWRPKKDLSQGLEKTIDWFKKNSHSYG